MKLGFWTLYDVDWTNEEIARRAADLGYQGVDLRVTAPGRTPGIGENLNLQSSLQDIERIKQAFAQAGVEISSLNCYNSSPTTTSRSAFCNFKRKLGLGSTKWGSWYPLAIESTLIWSPPTSTLVPDRVL